VLEIRQATETDHDAIWNIFHAVIARGDTYAFDPKMSREEALAYWFRSDTYTYVAEQDRQSVGEAVGLPRTAAPSPTVEAHERDIVGTYILRPNQPALGSHVANAAFMVAPNARGLGIGREMGEEPFACGDSSVSRSSAPCQVLFGIRKRDMSMFTSCFVRFCSRASVRRAGTSHSDVATKGWAPNKHCKKPGDW